MIPKVRQCDRCGWVPLTRYARAGRTEHYKGVTLELPMDLMLTECVNCGERYDSQEDGEIVDLICEDLYRKHACPICGVHVAPCQAELGYYKGKPLGICGEWECALRNDHYPQAHPELVRRHEEPSEARAFLESFIGPLTFAMIINSTRLGEEWTIAELAQRLGTTEELLEAVEAGLVAPTAHQAEAWARELGYSEDQWVHYATKAFIDLNRNK